MLGVGQALETLHYRYLYKHNYVELHALSLPSAGQYPRAEGGLPPQMAPGHIRCRHVPPPFMAMGACTAGTTDLPVYPFNIMGTIVKKC